LYPWRQFIAEKILNGYSRENEVMDFLHSESMRESILLEIYPSSAQDRVGDIKIEYFLEKTDYIQERAETSDSAVLKASSVPI
jgi:hypothetical protein